MVVKLKKVRQFEVTNAKFEKGYVLKTKIKDKTVTIRVMGSESGKTGKPYYRISYGTNGTVDIKGNYSSLPEPTHIATNNNSFRDVLNILKILEGKK